MFRVPIMGLEKSLRNIKTPLSDSLLARACIFAISSSRSFVICFEILIDSLAVSITPSRKKLTHSSTSPS